MKTISLFFILIMFGSTFAYALLNAFGRGGKIEIPKEKILDYELNEQQKRYLRSNYFTLVVYRYPQACLECGSIKSDLEQITQNSGGQIYLQEIVSNEHKVIISSLKGERIIDNPTKEKIESVICDLLIKTPIWCATSKL